MATTDQFAGAATAINSTWAILPSPKDLLLTIPRAASKAGSFFTDTFEVLENLFGAEIREQAMAAATGGTGGGAGTLGTAAVAAAEEEAGGALSYLTAFNMQQLRTFSGVLGYITSKWALCCFAVAIILNRTQVYSSTRRNLRPRWRIRLLIRSIAILPLLIQIHGVLRGIRCQTSPEFSLMRYGVEDRLTAIDFSQDGGFLYHLTSTILVGESDLQSCRAVRMVPKEEESMRSHGSLALIWPSFKALCFSKFVETLSCAVTGTPAATETGMSLFEHSLAFAETESMVGNVIGLGPLGSIRNETHKVLAATRGMNSTESATVLSKNAILSRFNTSPEVLLITLISLCNSASSHLLAIFDKQAQYRLLNTGVWGVCFLASFLWAFNSISMEQILDSGVFRFPTVCVVGFIPHLLIVAGIVLCAVIYLLALLLSALSPPPGSVRMDTWRARFEAAYDNMQANVHLSHVRINMREDFYTALLRLGLSTLTAASEAVFLNEGRHINLGQMTWLEEERLNDLDRARRNAVQSSTAFVQDAPDAVAAGVTFVESNPQGLVKSEAWKSGYARERTTKLFKHNNHAKDINNGVGAYQRHSRYLLAFNFLAKIFWLVIGWQLLTLDKVLSSIGIRYRPGWMRQALEGSQEAGNTSTKSAMPELGQRARFLMRGVNGNFVIPKDENIDVELETRRRLQSGLAEQDSAELEKRLDSRLYEWFTTGGWWGNSDNSGDFIPTSQDDDTTSVISTMTDNSDAWSTDGENDDGRRTPTQQDYRDTADQRSRDTSPINDLFTSKELVRLLDPKDSEARNDARILSRHLASDQILTRSQYRRFQGDSSTQVLTSTRFRPPGFSQKSASGALSPDEEAEVLEHLLTKFRKEKGAMRRGSQDDPFSGGPPCVVCQTAPRTIMSWPCRCLSLCEDCRVSLAMNNFGNCVCCRQEVVGFSRLYVP